MKSHTEYLKFHTRKHREYIHITPQIEAIVKKSGVKEGMVLVSAMHITAGVYVNDNESGLIEDIDKWLEQLAPFREDYRHHDTGETNGDSHLKALLVHHQSSFQSLPAGSTLALGSASSMPNSTVSGTSA
jgi:secondary thiamine-phosphate synthase enzyme